MFVTAAMLVALLASSSGQASIPALPNLPACTFDTPSRVVAKIRDLPGPITVELSRFFGGDRGGLAESGTLFNPTDYIYDRRVPGRRFIRAYLVRDVWFIWYEQGGIGRSNMMVALTRRAADAGGPSPYVVTPGSRFVGNLCAGSKAFLMGARSVG